MKMKIMRVVSAMALVVMMSSTAYALETSKTLDDSNVEQARITVDMPDDEVVIDAAYNMINILKDRYEGLLNLDENSNYYLYEVGVKNVDSYTVTKYRLEEKDSYSLGTLYLIGQNDVFKSIVFTGYDTDKSSDARLVKTWKSMEVGKDKISESKRLGIKSLGQYSSGLMQPWCAVTCSAAVMSYFDGIDKKPIQIAKTILPVVFDNKNRESYWDRNSDKFKNALGADIDMEYGFYNGINSYQLRDLFIQSGYQTTYTNSKTSRLYNIGSNIKSGSAVIAELSRNGRASHAIVFDEYTDRILVGFNPSYNDEKRRIVMVYGNKLIPDSISDTIIYVEDNSSKCYNITGYISIKLPTGRSSAELFKTETEYTTLLTDIDDIKDTIKEDNYDSVTDSIEFVSDTMVEWAKDDEVLNEVLADTLNIDNNQVGLYVEGTPSITPYGRAIIKIPELAVYAYMCTLSEYTVDKDIIKEINKDSTSDIRRAKTYVNEVAEVFGALKIGYQVGELSPSTWLDKMLNIRLHATTSVGATYKYDTMKRFIDQDKAVIMMFRNKDTNERYSVICVDADKLNDNNVKYTILDPFDANAGEIKKRFITCSTSGSNCYYSNELIPTNMTWVGSVVTEGTITEEVYNLNYNNYGKLVK